jgi:hypothetical protein
MTRQFERFGTITAYELLGVKPEATTPEILAGHRRAISRNHPDTGAAGDADGLTSLAQLINAARDLLLNDRVAYDEWLARGARPKVDSGADMGNQATQNVSDEDYEFDPWEVADSGPSPQASVVARGPQYVVADGRPAYFAPPGAVPISRSQPPPGPANVPRARPPQRFGGPDAFTGPLRQLAIQAQHDVFAVFGPADNPEQEQTHIEVADFLAALRFYRLIVAAAFSDDLISGGLGGQAAQFVRGLMSQYAAAPPSLERDQAIAVLRHVDSSPRAGVTVAMARLAIEKLAGRVR